MATRRFKSTTMKFGVPLSLPGSRYVEHCYGSHGAGYAGTPPTGASIDLILINALRQLWTASGTHPQRHEYVIDAVGQHDGWRLLGWRMADGTMPLGEYDAIDPELAQFEYLPLPNPDSVIGEDGPRASTMLPSGGAAR